MNKSREPRKGIDGHIVYTEPDTILGGGVLTRWREKYSNLCCKRWAHIAQMRIMQVHKGPDLPTSSATLT
jgi:hypothetical protein